MTRVSAAAPVMVAFVLGKGRSGSTVLGRILGVHPEVFYAGELRYLFTPEDGLAQRCECGEEFGRCPIWSAVLEDLESCGVSLSRAEKLVSAAHRWQSLLRALTPFSPSPGFLDEYADLLGVTYAAIGRVTGCGVIVDSCKWSLSPVVLADREHAVRAIHLVRALPGVVFSWSATKPSTRAGERGLRRIGLTSTWASWLARNVIAERVRHAVPYERVRYEDFLGDVRTGLADLGAFLDAPDLASLVDGGDSIDFVTGHSVAGNPGRTVTGRVELAADNRWVEGLPRWKLMWCRLLGAPLHLRYGYGFRGASASQQRVDHV